MDDRQQYQDIACARDGHKRCCGRCRPKCWAPPGGDRWEPVADRLAEIEARLDAASSWPIQSSGCHNLIAHAPTDLRDLLAVAKEADSVLRAYDQAQADADWTGALIDTRLRAALANLEGGA